MVYKDVTLVTGSLSVTSLVLLPENLAFKRDFYMEVLKPSVLPSGQSVPLLTCPALVSVGSRNKSVSRNIADFSFCLIKHDMKSTTARLKSIAISAPAPTLDNESDAMGGQITVIVSTRVTHRDPGEVVRNICIPELLLETKHIRAYKQN